MVVNFCDVTSQKQVALFLEKSLAVLGIPAATIIVSSYTIDITFIIPLTGVYFFI